METAVFWISNIVIRHIFNIFLKGSNIVAPVVSLLEKEA
jgi:hypothetical protein